MFILLVIVLNVIVMSFHSYEFRIDASKPPNSKMEDISSKVFVTIFLLEFAAKVVAMGFIMNPKSYLRSPWNVLDFLCLLTGLSE